MKNTILYIQYFVYITNTLHLVHIKYVLVHMHVCYNQICDTLIRVLHPPSLEDGWPHSVSGLHLAEVFFTFDVGSVVIVTLTGDSCLTLSNQLLTKEKFEFEELQWFRSQKLELYSAKQWPSKK